MQGSLTGEEYVLCIPRFLASALIAFHSYKNYTMAALLAGMASSSLASSGSNMMDKMKTMVGLKEEQPKTILSTIDEAVTLSWKQVHMDGVLDFLSSRAFHGIILG